MIDNTTAISYINNMGGRTMSFGVLKDTYGLPLPTSQVHVMS